jgi:O-antigen/teichoic acid export membrane protein
MSCSGVHIRPLAASRASSSLHGQRRTSLSETIPAEVAQETFSNEISGLRAGVIVFAGIGFANLGNYVFNLLSARSLGPSSYGDVATLTALTGIVGLPLGGAQIFVARHVAALAVRDRPLNDDGYVSAFAGACIVAGIGLTVFLLALSPVIQRALSIHSLWAVVFTVAFTTPAFLSPALLGAAQGRQRFFLLAVAIGGPPLVRIVLVAVFLTAGFGATGAMAATFVASLIGVGVVIVPLRNALAPIRAWRPRMSRRDLIALLPVIGGLLATTALSSDDLVVAKAFFSSHEAGIYGSASLIGRIILYLPAAIVTVLLPKVSARAAENRDTSDILVQSLAVTAAFCVAVTILYAVAPHTIVRIAFGAKYDASGPLLWMFGIAMSTFALLNVLLTYQLGHGQSRTSWLLLGGAVVQALLFTAFHASPRELLACSIVVGATLFVLHEAFVAPLLTRALRRRG